jgi:hypothetical protein
MGSPWWPTRSAHSGRRTASHGELMHGALRNQNAITWHLIQVLEKLEKGVS